MVNLKASTSLIAGVDLVRVPALAAALTDDMLELRCSACFCSIEHKRLNCPGCSGKVGYCSVTCLEWDKQLHTKSSECHFLKLHLSELTHNTCDVRTALRLLARTGATSRNGRLAGLVTNHSKLLKHSEFGPEIACLARGMLFSRDVPTDEDAKRCEDALCVVITNGVEVQLVEATAQEQPARITVGTAVYTSGFSWLNHSCRPNANYRFVLHYSTSKQQRQHLTNSWENNEEQFECCTWESQEASLHPWVVVRSIEDIPAGREVTIAYTDLLQPKGARRLELEDKYMFTCSCVRCQETCLNDVSLETIGNCKVQGCSGWLNIDARCSKCGEVHSDAERVHLIRTMLTTIDAASEAFMSADNAKEWADNPKDCMLLLETCISKLSSDVIGNSTCLNALMILRSSYRTLAGVEEGNNLGIISRISVLLATTIQDFYDEGEHGLCTLLSWLWLDAGKDMLDYEKAAKVDDDDTIAFHKVLRGWQIQLPSSRECLKWSWSMSILSFGKDHELSRYLKSMIS